MGVARVDAIFNKGCKHKRKQTHLIVILTETDHNIILPIYSISLGTINEGKFIMMGTRCTQILAWKTARLQDVKCYGLTSFLLFPSFF